MTGAIGRLLGSIAGEGVSKPIEAVGNVLDKLFTSDDEKLGRQEVLERLAQRPGELQVELNKIEAAHASIFVAGWRPAIGWVCALSLGTYYVPQGALGAFLWARECIVSNTLLPFPPLQIDGLTELVVAMLGLGVLRTVEKMKGVTK